MTVIRPNSISGINSITAHGGDITYYKSDGTAGNQFTHNIQSTGVITATKFVGAIEATTGTFSGNLGVAGALTYEDVTNVDSVGVITARQGIRIGAGKSIGSDGADVVYYGDGSNLTGAGPTLTNGADNRVITATSASAITGEANLTFNGGATGDAQLTVHAEQNDSGADSELILETSNDFATSVIMFKDSTAEAGSVAYNHGDNYIKFSTNGTDGGTERMRVASGGIVTKPYQPSFEASYPDAYDNLAGASHNITTWLRVHHNIGSHFNASNGRFTAPVDGRYLVSAHMTNVSHASPHIAFTINDGSYAAGPSRSGTDYTETWHISEGSGGGINSTHIFDLSANDYVRVTIWNYTGTGDDPRCYFCGYLLG